MKKIQTSHSESLSPVKLYLDDLESIYDVLKESAEQVEMSDDEYEFSNLIELKEVKKELLTRFYFKNHNPYLSLDLKPYEARMFIYKDDPISRGLLEKVKQILWRCRRPYLIPSAYSVLVLSMLIFLIVFISNKNTNIVESLTGVFFLIGGLAYYIYITTVVLTKQYSIIIPKYRTEAPSFLKRNKDNILLAIIAAFFGDLITLILVWLGLKP